MVSIEPDTLRVGMNGLPPDFDRTQRRPSKHQQDSAPADEDDDGGVYDDAKIDSMLKNWAQRGRDEMVETGGRSAPVVDSPVYDLVVQQAVQRALSEPDLEEEDTPLTGSRAAGGEGGGEERAPGFEAGQRVLYWSSHRGRTPRKEREAGGVGAQCL